ncbi:MAG: HEAT repeat domain-containing protein [Desulfobacteraceae bacterium]|nr:HEAT repeat domain-containing protein [Desulfobacteraceae bacterium]
MKKVFAITFLIVLILSGFFFFFLTFTSNQHLYFIIILLKEAGHIVAPNSTILSSMLDFKVVLFASFFITFTAGLVIALTIACFMSSIFMVRDSFFKFTEMIIPIIIAITFVFTTLCIYDGKDLFSRIRDSFLLSSDFGRDLNNFYYKYTLYAAETIKSPMQKQIKLCWIDPNIKERTKLKKTLFKFGWLSIDNKIANELVIDKNYQSKLVFKHKGKILLITDTGKFIANPEKFLSSYSSKTDSRQLLRALCSIGLMPGIPFFIFFIVCSGIFVIFRIVTNSKNACRISSTISALLLIGLLFYLNPEIIRQTNETTAKKMLFSQEAKDRIRGLRIIYSKNYFIEDYPNTASKLIKGTTAEKYWLANTLGMTSNKQNIKNLNTLINDDSINVKCAAINALSEIDSTKNSFKLFKKIINNSDQWYVQYYAYNAYKKWIITN